VFIDTKSILETYSYVYLNDSRKEAVLETYSYVHLNDSRKEAVLETYSYVHLTDTREEAVGSFLWKYVWTGIITKSENGVK